MAPLVTITMGLTYGAAPAALPFVTIVTLLKDKNPFAPADAPRPAPSVIVKAERFITGLGVAPKLVALKEPGLVIWIEVSLPFTIVPFAVGLISTVTFASTPKPKVSGIVPEPPKPVPAVNKLLLDVISK